MIQLFSALMIILVLAGHCRAEWIFFGEEEAGKYYYDSAKSEPVDDNDTLMSEVIKLELWNSESILAMTLVDCVRRQIIISKYLWLNEGIVKDKVVLELRKYYPNAIWDNLRRKTCKRDVK